MLFQVLSFFASFLGKNGTAKPKISNLWWGAVVLWAYLSYIILLMVPKDRGSNPPGGCYRLWKNIYITWAKQDEKLKVNQVQLLPSFLLPQSLDLAYLNIFCQDNIFTDSLFTCFHIQWQGLSLSLIIKCAVGGINSTERMK